MNYYGSNIDPVITGSEEISGDRAARTIRKWNDDLAWATKVKVKTETLMDRSTVMMMQNNLELMREYEAEAEAHYRPTSPELMKLKRMAASRIAALEISLAKAKDAKRSPFVVGKIQKRIDALRNAMIG